jgi:hypothetical protein
LSAGLGQSSAEGVGWGIGRDTSEVCRPKAEITYEFVPASHSGNAPDWLTVQLRWAPLATRQRRLRRRRRRRHGGRETRCVGVIAHRRYLREPGRDDHRRPVRSCSVPRRDHDPAPGIVEQHWLGLTVPTLVTDGAVRRHRSLPANPTVPGPQRLQARHQLISNR